MERAPFLLLVFAAVFTCAFSTKTALAAPASSNSCEGLFSRPNRIVKLAIENHIQKLETRRTRSRNNKTPFETPEMNIEVVMTKARDSKATSKPILGFDLHTTSMMPVALRDAATGIEWIDNDSLSISEGSIQSPGQSHTTMHLQFLKVLNGPTKKMQSFNAFRSNNADHASFFINKNKIADDAVTYRFFDKKSMIELRPPIATDYLNVHNQYFSYYRDGIHYLSSIRADFDEIELPRRKLQRVSRDGLMIEANDVAYEYDSHDATFKTRPGLQFRDVLTTSDGQRYFVTDETESSWSIRAEHSQSAIHLEVDKLKKGRRVTSKSSFARVDAIVGKPGHQAALVNVYAEDFTSVRKLVILESYYVEYGNQDRAIATAEDAYSRIDRLSDRFLVLYRETPKPADQVTLVDVETGKRVSISSHHSHLSDLSQTAMISADRYVNIFTQDTGQGTIVLRRLGSDRQLGYSLLLQGRAAVIPGTYVLRVVDGEKVEFIDLDKLSTLWVGDRSQLPSLSPDGSRVAFIIRDQLHIQVLGPTYESRQLKL